MTLALVLLLVIMATAISPSDAQSQIQRNARLSSDFLNSGDRKRAYHTYVPASYTGDSAVPLVVLLHGGGGFGRRMVSFTGFDSIAERACAIVVCPDGIERHWNDGRKGTGYKAHDDDIDDVGFIDALIAEICRSYNIDQRRIFVAGISNGGMMAYRLGMELPDRFAAIAPVACALPETLSERAPGTRPMPAVIVNGTEDPIISWQGGEIRIRNKRLGKILSVPDSVAYWARKNRCHGKPRVAVVPGTDRHDGLYVTRAEYRPDPQGADLVFYSVVGGGHTWPGPRQESQYLPDRLIGKSCKDFDATEAIWNFFAAHPKPGSKNHVPGQASVD